MSRLVLFLILLVCVFSQSCEDITDFFEHAFDEFDEAYCGTGIYGSRINQGSNGKYLVVGNGPLFAVINKDGEQDISRKYEFDIDIDATTATDLSNDYLIAGKIRKNSIEEFHQNDLFVARVDGSGEMIWDKRFVMDPNVDDVEIFKLPDDKYMIISSLWRYTSGTIVLIIDENGLLLDSTNFSNYIPAVIETRTGGFAYISDSILFQTDKDFNILEQWETNKKYGKQIRNMGNYVIWMTDLPM